MKHLFTLVLLISVMSSLAQAPGIQWQKSYGGKHGEIANVIRQTKDGGYIVAGCTSSNDGDVVGFSGGTWGAGTGNTDMWVIRLDKTGGLKWSKCLGASWIDEATDVRQTKDGGFAVAGWGNCGVCPFNYYLYKLDSNGTEKWFKNYGGNTSDEATSMQLTKDGGFILAGTSFSIDGQVTGHHNTVATSDYWVVKTDTAGNIQWQKSYGGSANEKAATISPTKDGGYLISGHSQSNDGDVTGHHGTTCLNYGWCNDIWIVKIDSVGSIQWQKTLGGTQEDEAVGAQQTADGGYIVAGMVKSKDGDVTGHHGNPDYWLAKLNASGTLQWAKAYGGIWNDEPRSVQQTNDGGYIIAGRSNAYDGDVTGNLGYFDYWIVKTDNSGKLQWEKCYGGTDAEEAMCVQQTADNGFVFAGYTFSPVGNDITLKLGSSDFWIVKTAGTTTGISDLSSQRISVYPNPTNGFFNVTLPPSTLNACTEVYNSTGTLIIKQTATNAANTIDLSNQAHGLYFIKVISDNRIIDSHKIIKQ